MPDESCRHCGGKLLNFSQCAECKKITRMICQSCRQLTMEQFHSQCVMGLVKPQFLQPHIFRNLHTLA